MYFAIALILLSSVASCQTVDDGWKGIKPLHTGKGAAEKLLGKAKVDDNNYHMYTNGDVSVEINYSTSPCKKEQYNRGKFDVPESTVLGYRVLFKTYPKLSELKFNKEKYENYPGGHVPNLEYFSNYEDGIRIEVVMRNGDQFVQKIEYSPSKSDSKKLACK